MSVKETIIQLLKKDRPFFVMETRQNNLYADMGFDSISYIQFLLKLEKSFAITFELTEMETGLQLDQLITLIEDKVNKREGGNDSKCTAQL